MLSFKMKIYGKYFNAKDSRKRRCFQDFPRLTHRYQQGSTLSWLQRYRAMHNLTSIRKVNDEIAASFQAKFAPGHKFTEDVLSVEFNRATLLLHHFILTPL